MEFSNFWTHAKKWILTYLSWPSKQSNSGGILTDFFFFFSRKIWISKYLLTLLISTQLQSKMESNSKPRKTSSGHSNTGFDLNTNLKKNSYVNESNWKVIFILGHLALKSFVKSQTTNFYDEFHKQTEILCFGLQCGNYGHLLSHFCVETFREYNDFINEFVLFLSSWFDEIFFRCEYIFLQQQLFFSITFWIIFTEKFRYSTISIWKKVSPKFFSVKSTL